MQVSAPSSLFHLENPQLDTSGDESLQKSTASTRLVTGRRTVQYSTVPVISILLLQDLPYYCSVHHHTTAVSALITATPVFVKAAPAPALELSSFLLPAAPLLLKYNPYHCGTSRETPCCCTGSFHTGIQPLKVCGERATSLGLSGTNLKREHYVSDTRNSDVPCVERSRIEISSLLSISRHDVIRVKSRPGLRAAWVTGRMYLHSERSERSQVKVEDVAAVEVTPGRDTVSAVFLAVKAVERKPRNSRFCSMTKNLHYKLNRTAKKKLGGERYCS
ncbi:hypothetical protein F2P81_019890 [Scophthalmus maximus]|uniref:Uncharacterized protein n=1 Tax=Scophthalmus maximus TaxID=52904 RepID=A0A6A4S3R5_SCOMX|nr:hypothetical protein F2P81_019890 [Scophthalmus maximus]